MYVGSPAHVRRSRKIRQWIDETTPEGYEVPEDIRELAKFVRDHIHPKYDLADMLERGVAFHFGRMPTILRKALEHYFAAHPQFIIRVHKHSPPWGQSTSKNLFMLKPSQGRVVNKEGRSDTPASFWNLAGCAGRLGKDFEGRFFVNKSTWKEDPLKAKNSNRSSPPSIRCCSPTRDYFYRWHVLMSKRWGTPQKNEPLKVLLSSCMPIFEGDALNKFCAGRQNQSQQSSRRNS